MLIIECRAGESIQIGDEIRISVLDTDGDSVRVGISAPRDMPVRVLDERPPTTPLAEQNVPLDRRKRGAVTTDEPEKD